MPPFALLDAPGWSIVIGAAGIVLMQALTAYLAYRTARDKDMRETTAKAVEKAELKAERAEAAVEFEKNKAEALVIAAEAKAKLADIADKVEVVHKQGNSNQDKMMAAVHAASYAEGVRAEKGGTANGTSDPKSTHTDGGP